MVENSDYEDAYSEDESDVEEDDDCLVMRLTTVDKKKLRAP